MSLYQSCKYIFLMNTAWYMSKQVDISKLLKLFSHSITCFCFSNIYDFLKSVIFAPLVIDHLKIIHHLHHSSQKCQNHLPVKFLNEKHMSLTKSKPNKLETFPQTLKHRTIVAQIQLSQSHTSAACFQILPHERISLNCNLK